MDWPLFGSAFTLDAIWDLRGFAIARNPKTNEWNSKGSSFDLAFLEQFSNSLSWPVVGRAAIEAAARDIMADVTASFHRLFNPEIDILSEESARAVWPFEETIQFSDGSAVNYMNGLGYYHETYELIGESWLTKTCQISRTIFNIA
jgi:hypothetical protein